MNANTNYHTTEIASRLLKSLTKVSSERAIIFAKCAPGEISEIIQRLEESRRSGGIPSELTRFRTVTRKRGTYLIDMIFATRRFLAKIERKDHRTIEADRKPDGYLALGIGRTVPIYKIDPLKLKIPSKE
jgi:hypothetical protein